MKKDFIVYKESDKFAAWPAGYICESWGEEILASYLVCDYLNAERGHHFIRENPWYIYISRSTDNGRTWYEDVFGGQNDNSKYYLFVMCCIVSFARSEILTVPTPKIEV